MSKRLRGSYSVYKETVANKNFVATEMFVISAGIGYLASSWVIWLLSLLLLFGSLGTKLGLIIGWIITIIWSLFIGGVFYLSTENIELSLVSAFIAGGISWYTHSCGNLYWRDFTEAEWW